MNRFLKSDFFHDFLKAPIALISFIVVFTLILLALFANLIVLGPITGVSISRTCPGFDPLIKIPPASNS